METRTVLDYISERGCSVKTEKYIVDSGVEYPVGQSSREAYYNSTQGRAKLKKDYPDYYKALTMTAWGSKPTVDEDAADTL